MHELRKHKRLQLGVIVTRNRLLLSKQGTPIEQFPSVCCIVLNWNGWRDTVLCLESLRKSDYPQLAILMVDNGSTDDSVRLIRERCPWVEVLETHANLGFAGGNNRGIQVALDRGVKYIWLLNNDTIVETGTLTALVETAESDPSLGEVGSVLFFTEHPDKVQDWGGGAVNLWTGTSRHYFEPVAPEKLDFISAASVLIPSHVLRQIGLLDEGYFMYWEDTDLSYRIRAAGWKLGVAPSATLLHKESGSTGPKTAILENYISTSGIRFFSKFAPLPWVPIFFLVFGRAARRFLIFEWKLGWATLNGLKDHLNR
jgi:GT2 family glycosyltransferase